ncbi:MAG: MFS transporter [Bacteroidales bacterium]|jgi:MFS family permease|nr:MFS transporter [Bacteroidales bacterium]
MFPYKRNIYSLYLIKIAKWFMVYMPIVVLFFQDNGLGMKEILTLQSIYSIAIILLEIPSGYLSDVWGRRNTLILGSVLGTIGFFVYSNSTGFYGFLTAQLILGTGQSFISGSDSALLYDSLKLAGKENQYVKYEGQILSIGNFSETIAAVVGGFLAEISLRTPFHWQTAIAAIAIPAAIFTVEPKLYTKEQVIRFKNIINIVKLCLYKSRELFVNILFSAIVGCATLTMAWILQAYLAGVHNFSEYQIGISWSVLNLTVGISTIFAYKFERTFGKRTTVFIILLVTGGVYILLGLTTSVIVFIAIWLFYFIRGVATPVLKNYINELCEPNVRATVLSIRNLAIRLIFAVVAPFIGWYTDVYSINQAFLLSGIFIIVFGAIAFTIFIPYLKNKQ